jgi:glucoamylase
MPSAKCHLVMGCSRGFLRRSAGYVGTSDGWQDLMNNFKMGWEFHAAEDGNIALTGEVDLQAQRWEGRNYSVAVSGPK